MKVMRKSVTVVVLASSFCLLAACGGTTSSSSSSVRTKNGALGTLPPKLQTTAPVQTAPTTTEGPPITLLPSTVPVTMPVPRTTMAPGACTISASFRNIVWCKPAQSWTYSETSGNNVGTKKTDTAGGNTNVLSTNISVSAYATGVLVSIRFVDGTSVSGVKIAFKTSAYPVPQ